MDRPLAAAVTRAARLMDRHGAVPPELSAHELRLWPDQRDVMGNPLYHFDMCLLDGALAGLILYWDFGTYIYVEHFCVEPSLRGHGLGTLILAELARQNKTIILEIDPLVDDASVRRKGFYERCGYVANGFARIRRHIRRPTTTTRSSL
ncbi:MAG: GNAT family N-acetyltransferase [Christensenellales bacterium]